MNSITLTCPHCKYKKVIEREKIPVNTKEVNCPRCKKAFLLSLPSPPKQSDSNENIYAPPQDDKPFEANSGQIKYCSTCGEKINYKAEICPKCGVRVAPPPNAINKVALLLMTFFFGGIGGHKFYQKKYLQGVLFLLFFWTYIPTLIAIVEFIIYAFTSEEKLRIRYPEGSSNAAIIAVCMSFMGIAMIGILAAIAIPQFAAYRERAFHATASRNLMDCHTRAEEYISTRETYPASIDDLSCKVSDDVSLYYLALGPKEYQLVSYHNKGTKAFLLSSEDTQIKENTREEIKKQLGESLGQAVLTPEFHFIN